MSKFKIGDKVNWIDPAIEDFDLKDREFQLSQVFVVVELFDDETALIANDFSEAEVFISELKHI
jgi:hypothetical protein